VPVAAKGAAVGLTLAFDAGEEGRIKRVALRAVAALAGAPVLSFVLGGLLHEVRVAG
jgi:hypothetical protein